MSLLMQSATAKKKYKKEKCSGCPEYEDSEYLLKGTQFLRVN